MDATLEAIRIVTRCTSREQFVAMFSRYCSATSCFIPSSDSRPIGTATAFSIRLADGTQLLRGEGVVLQAWSHGDHGFKRPGIELGIHRLDDSCAELFDELIRPRSVAVPIPPANQLQMLLAAQPSVSSELETPTVEMPPLALPEEPRVPPSPFVLPANPLTEMTDDLLSAFVECNLLAEDVQPLASPTDTTIPTELPHDPTVKNKRDVIATILGVAPLPKQQVFAAPQLVATELIDRVESPRSSLRTPVQRPLTLEEPIANIAVAEVDTDAVAITYAAAPQPLPERRPTPRAAPRLDEPAPVQQAIAAYQEPSRPRQRMRFSALGVVPITQVVRGGRSLGRLRRRIARAMMPGLKRWWIPAAVATTIVATTVTAVFVV